MIQELLKELAQLDGVEAVALGGSRAGDRYDEKSDYDIYLYCRGPVDEEKRRELLKRYCSHMEIGNHYWELEDNCTLSSGVDIDILYRRLEDFVEGVAQVVEGHQAHNGYTTCMWHNLLTCRVLYDPHGKLQAAKKRFDVAYPQALRENIIIRNRKLLGGCLPSYDLQIQKAAGRMDQVSLCHRTAAFMESYFDVIFALNRLTHPGEKRLVSLCRERCSLLPERFEENIEALYESLFSCPQRAEDHLRRMIGALDCVLEQEGF